MERPEPDAASEDAMDSFLEKFQSQPYRGRFREDRWEEEFEKIPLFMKKAPSEIDPKENPDLACLQSIIFDDERPPEEQAKTYKDEGNEYFKEKDYEKAVISYTEGLKKKCADPDLNAVLYTNRAAAQYYLGNFRSALNDVTAARKLKPCHLKAIVRGALCHLELKNFAEAMKWCDEGLQIDAKEKKLLEMRIKADKLKASPPLEPAYRDPTTFLDDKPQEVLTQGLSLAATETETRMERMSTCADSTNDKSKKEETEPPGSESSEETRDILTDIKEVRDQLLERIDSVLGAIDRLAKLKEAKFKSLETKRTEQRDIRKAKLKEKKEQNQNEALLQAIKARNIRLVSEATSEDEDSASDGLSALLEGLSFENPYGARLSVDDQGRLSWPVLFLYPEHAQSDFISAFHEDSRFIDHLMVMFGETPSWDLEQKYCPDNLEVYFEDEDRAELYRVPPKSTLLQVLQHPRYLVKTLTPAFLVCVESSPFCRNYLWGRKVHQVK